MRLSTKFWLLLLFVFLFVINWYAFVMIDFKIDPPPIDQPPYRIETVLVGLIDIVLLLAIFVGYFDSINDWIDSFDNNALND